MKNVYDFTPKQTKITTNEKTAIKSTFVIPTIKRQAFQLLNDHPMHTSTFMYCKRTLYLVLSTDT
jgi:hypothetical protein